jgi:hypothetical protein
MPSFGPPWLENSVIITVRLHLFIVRVLSPSLQPAAAPLLFSRYFLPTVTLLCRFSAILGNFPQLLKKTLCR